MSQHFSAHSTAYLPWERAERATANNCPSFATWDRFCPDGETYAYGFCRRVWVMRNLPLAVKRMSMLVGAPERTVVQRTRVPLSGLTPLGQRTVTVAPVRRCRRQLQCRARHLGGGRDPALSRAE